MKTLVGAQGGSLSKSLTVRNVLVINENTTENMCTALLKETVTLRGCNVSRQATVFDRGSMKEIDIKDQSKWRFGILTEAMVIKSYFPKGSLSLVLHSIHTAFRKKIIIH